jgi:HKD family nuclease
MSFRLVDQGWDRELDQSLAANSKDVRIICPFIKDSAAERLLRQGKPDSLQVITRFNLCDFSDGVSDVAALRLLLENGAQIRGVRHLHAKVYLFGSARVIVTSANLTNAALTRNHEFGFVAEEAGIVQSCNQYFDSLWTRAGHNLQVRQLAEWEQRIEACLAAGARPSIVAGLGDEGVDAGIPEAPLPLPPRVGDADQAFVKFFGESDDRASRSMPVTHEVLRSGSHWACTFPHGKRPRSVRDGAILFMGRLVKDPDDILIHGRAEGMRHKPGHDDATSRDIQLREWKAKWPHYVRVHHAVFVGGTLANGISLSQLMHLFKADSFASTQRNAAAGQGNTDPRKAYMRQAAVELSLRSMWWLDEQLERAYARHGKMVASTRDDWDWPDPAGPR